MANSTRRLTAKRFGSGRIVFWRGGSLWIGHAVEETAFHEHHAIQITLTLSGDVIRLFRPGQAWVAYTAAIVAAHQSHAFEARGELVALVFAEPESLEGRALRDCYSEGVTALDHDGLADQASQLAAFYAQGASDADLADCARSVITKLSSIHPASAQPLDHRIARAIGLLREQIGHPVRMTDIAEAVHLSPERFRHLFVQETGIRFRPYVRWLRLEVAVALYGAGSSLTDASHAGGFADSAHFSRTFKRMFGVTAIGVQRA